jgi:hypothetical protein
VLIQRKPADPAVQEALLAVPYAYSRLNAREQAIEHYRTAIQSYESERKSLQRTIEVVRKAPLPNATRYQPTRERPLAAWQLPRSDDLLYLGSLLASDPFQATLQDWHELARLERELRPMQDRLQDLGTRLDGGSAMTEADPTEVTAPDENKPAMTTGPRITYFGVFDFQPPTRAPDPAEASDTTPPLVEPEVGESADDAAMVEPEPRPARRKTETPVEKLAQLRTRMDSLQQQIRQAEATQQRALRQMALDEIADQQSRLDTYLAQARFSLARLLDPTASRSEEP